MLRVVLDTNVIAASISHKSPYHWVWLAFMEGRFELCVSTDMLAEYAEVLDRHFPKPTSESALAQIMLHRNVIHIVRYFEWNVIVADPDDNKFFDCAVAANAHYLVTEDKHFNILKDLPFPRVKAVKIQAFWQLLYGDIPLGA